MLSCPACTAESAAGQTRCACGYDLGLLQSLVELADAWFNRALESLRAGQRGRALEWFSACCAARPNDAAARLAQAQVWAQLGRLDEAREAARRVRELDPAQPGLAELDAALRASGAARGDRTGAGRQPRRSVRHG